MRYFIFLCVFIVCGSLVESAHAAAPFKRRVPLNEVYYLSSKGPRDSALVCYKFRSRRVIALPKAIKNNQITISEIVSTKKTKAMLKAAKIECNAKIQSPQCNDGRDNDLDGLRDYPLDPACESTVDTVEDAFDGNTQAYRVFTKPFAEEFSLGSLFDHQYPLEFIHTDNVIISTYEDQTAIGVDGHQGYDFSMDEGTPLLATYNGTVSFAGLEDPFFCPLLGQSTAGNTVILEHQVGSDRFYSIYGHLSVVSVTAGQQVTTGQQLGLSGNTGCSTGPHLHFDIQRDTNTNDGKSSSFDPFGWNGTSTDPWSVHAEGTTSFRLWASGAAPQEFRFSELAPNPGEGNNAPVAITHIQWAGPRDDQTPNDEYVELFLDTRFNQSSSFALSGYRLKNNAGESFVFPQGTTINAGTPIRVYSGTGVNSSTTFYWNRTSGAWSNFGDCARLVRSSDNSLRYYHFYGDNDCVFSTADQRRVSGSGTTVPLDMSR